MAELVSSSEGLSGAEVVAMVQEAAMAAQDAQAPTLTLVHLRTARAGLTSQITRPMLAYYSKMQIEFRSSTA
jgi:SpoVK/Ycf46/Vps4 family AAA+-type ATPase